MSFGVTLPESRDLTRLERISIHSHINGLGVDAETGMPQTGSSLVGQVAARRAAWLVTRMVKEGRIGGRGVLLAGPAGTGKTALALAMAQTLGEQVPFVAMTGSEVFSRGVGRTEALTQAMRRAVGVRIREKQEVIEGEVVEVQLDRTATGKGQGKLTLRTTDMETVYELGAKLMEALAKESVQSGDVIQIIKASGKVTRLGRSYARARDWDAMGPDARLVPCPEGELQQTRDQEHVVTLHDIDVINSRSQGYLALFTGDTGEIRPEIRDQINRRVQEWREEGKATLCPGILFIDEAHLLDAEGMAWLNRALEDESAPLLILASNRGMARVRGSPASEGPCAHGLAPDLLDRCLIISTQPYQPDELAAIINMRAQQEGVELSEAARHRLVEIAQRISLRYALQLATCSLYHGRNRSAPIQVQTIDRLYNLFLDEQRSAALIK